MNYRNTNAIRVAILTLAGTLLPGAPLLHAQSPTQAQTRAPQTEPQWHNVSVQLPVSTQSFPAGHGSDIANSQCLICHSAGMVLRQPERTEGQWKATIDKMRTAYGAPLPAEQVDALAMYLVRVVGHADGADAGEKPSTASSSSDGATVFAARCAACHQLSGTGLPGVFPPLAGSNWVNGAPGTLARIVLHGVQGTLTVNGTAYNGAMPPFAEQLSDAEIAAVLTYIRSQWGNKGAPVGDTVVSAQRSATAARSAPWNGEAELAGMK